MNKITASILLVTAAFAVIQNSPVKAAESNCQIIYGGGQTCTTSTKFTINKLVQVPGKGGSDFVENLTVNDAKFSAGQIVNFKIVVTNTGTADISNLTVVDSFPQFIKFNSGAGTHDSGNNRLTFSVGSLKASESREFIISGKVVDENALPQDAGITCVTNSVRAMDASGAFADDASQVCIQKSVLAAAPGPQVFEKIPLKQIPATGPELYSLFALIPTGIAGIYLKRKSGR